MGIDLTLAPIRYPDLGWWLASDTLTLNRDGTGHIIGGMELTPTTSIEPVTTRPIPENIRVDWYGDSGVTEIKTDSYGDKLQYATAGDLASVMSKIKNMSPWNKAIKSFIKGLPKDNPVVLYWH